MNWNQPQADYFRGFFTKLSESSGAVTWAAQKPHCLSTQLFCAGVPPGQKRVSPPPVLKLPSTSLISMYNSFLINNGPKV